MKVNSPKGYKTLWEKEKLLVMSNFSFSHNVFKRLVLQTRKSKGLFGKELIVKTEGEKKERKLCISLTFFNLCIFILYFFKGSPSEVEKNTFSSIRLYIIYLFKFLYHMFFILYLFNPFPNDKI